MKGIVKFVQEVRAEMRKVVWPSFDALLGSTGVVLLIIFLFSCYLGVVDLTFGTLIEKIVSL